MFMFFYHFNGVGIYIFFNSYLHIMLFLLALVVSIIQDKQGCSKPQQVYVCMMQLNLF